MNANIRRTSTSNSYFGTADQVISFPARIRSGNRFHALPPGGADSSVIRLTCTTRLFPGVRLRRNGSRNRCCLSLKRWRRLTRSESAAYGQVVAEEPRI